jgi:hypothetical protein
LSPFVSKRSDCDNQISNPYFPKETISLGTILNPDSTFLLTQPHVIHIILALLEAVHLTSHLSRDLKTVLPCRCDESGFSAVHISGWNEDEKSNKVNTEAFVPESDDSCLGLTGFWDDEGLNHCIQAFPPSISSAISPEARGNDFFLPFQDNISSRPIDSSPPVFASWTTFFLPCLPSYVPSMADDILTMCTNALRALIRLLLSQGHVENVARLIDLLIFKPTVKGVDVMSILLDSFRVSIEQDSELPLTTNEESKKTNKALLSDIHPIYALIDDALQFCLCFSQRDVTTKGNIQKEFALDFVLGC